MADTVIFKPRRRVLYDVLFGVNILFLLLYSASILSVLVLIVTVAVINIGLILSWFFVIQNVFKIKISQNVITGPSKSLFPTSFLLRKVDHLRLHERSNFERALGLYNIWSVEGTRILLIRRLIGRSPTSKILSIIEKYPFRESLSPVTKSG
ncbi:MAG: hypothetical protein JW893_06780 [Candidatus Omnitrophica bacterium]|nr:hypothetical protein [Candidatus Omnitrophota bacterium]